MGSRIASCSNVPEGPVVASPILLPDRMEEEAGRGAVKLRNDRPPPGIVCVAASSLISSARSRSAEQERVGLLAAP